MTHGLRVFALGGGTGLSGLKHFVDPPPPGESKDSFLTALTGNFSEAVRAETFRVARS